MRWYRSGSFRAELSRVKNGFPAEDALLMGLVYRRDCSVPPETSIELTNRLSPATAKTAS